MKGERHQSCEGIESCQVYSSFISTQSLQYNIKSDYTLFSVFWLMRHNYQQKTYVKLIIVLGYNLKQGLQ